ncbi:polysaccharide biosynthesis/export family protein [Litoribacter populi]|uniref:polysaccharide biosynthesis/export family protein n=1 Tax=Litoribacter populi TaxID=2598460 RepID=UPI00117E13D5|nr:polysaccharide biosynthesis/export family protein [Litoribacter populi]
MNKGFYLLLLLLLASSCISNRRITYFQNLPDNEPIGLEEFIPYAEVEYEYILQPFDIVDIDFATSDEELTKAFEFQGSRSMRGGMAGGRGGMGGGDIFYFTGYTIDKDGFVEIPKLGKIEIAGMSEESARLKVQQEINEFFQEEVFVRLRTGGIRYTTLGEFSSVGTQLIMRNRATIFDALANAGEANILAKKNQLFIIRQYDGGTKIHQINLNDRRLLASPYYFIQPNDILYLEPMRIRQVGTGDNLVQSLQLGATLVTMFIFFYGLTQGWN